LKGIIAAILGTPGLAILMDALQYGKAQINLTDVTDIYSLVLQVGDDWFTVYLIPETLRVTVLGIKGEGDSVNIEIEAQTQAIVDTVERVVQQYLEKKM
jgi:riboflavin synthase alpha subunit